VVRPAWKTFDGSSGVRKRKLLGVGTGDQEPPEFCTEGLKFAQIAFFAESGAYCGAEFV